MEVGDFDCALFLDCGEKRKPKGSSRRIENGRHTKAVASTRLP